MSRFVPTFVLRLLDLALLGALVSAHPAAAQRVDLFKDNFRSGSADPAWVSKVCCQQVHHQRLYFQGADGESRDALAIVHDSDPTWTDYGVSVTVAFAHQTPWEHANVILRSDGFYRGSNGAEGTAYQLEFYGRKGWLPRERNRITLIRTDIIHHSWITLYEGAWTPPAGHFDVKACLEGGRIRLWVDKQPVFDVTDPEPFLFGGVGLHTVWETRTWYDNVVVARVPGCAME